MLRIRFHGRGGHGVKTASRILGTAAFLSGLQAQDSPVYGAERRGAALAAYTRIAPGPIRERGVIAHPDLILVADETLLDDVAAGPLVGAETASGLFINSVRDATSIAHHYELTCPAFTLDLTALAVELLGRGSALSSLLGAAACALTGVAGADVTEQAVREELAELRLPSAVIQRNVEAARRVHAGLPALEMHEQPPASATSALHVPTYEPGPEGVPLIYAPGNSTARHTGSWRLFRPVIDRDVCTRCRVCLVRCPDSAIALDPDGYPVIDYDNCKGCLICAHGCPVRCVQEQREVRAW